MVVRKSVSLVACFGLSLLGAVAANAATTFDTMPSWNGSSNIGNFAIPDTATYGQTFVAPIDPLMTDYTFHLNPYPGSTLQMRGEVYAWSGSLLGGGGGGATGAMLYQSAPIVLNGNNAFQSVTVNPNITLTPGSQYVALLTMSNPTDFAASSGASIWGLSSNSHVANSGGGGFVFYNNGNNHAALNTTSWNHFFDFGDLAWTAHFSRGNAAVPEPGNIAMLAGMGISGVGFLMRRRRK